MARFELCDDGVLWVDLDSTDNTDTLEIPDEPMYRFVKSVFISCTRSNRTITKLIFPSCISHFGNEYFLRFNRYKLPIRHIEFKADNICVECGAFSSIDGTLQTIKVSGRNPVFMHNAFQFFRELREVEFGHDPLKILAKNTFYGCNKLDITCLLKEGLLGIESLALFDCNAYDKRVILPETLQTIVSDSFNGVKNLKEIEFSGAGLSVNMRGIKLFGRGTSIDFYIGDSAEIDTNSLGHNVNIIRKPPCEKDNAINRLRSKYRILTGKGDSGFISYGMHSLSIRQTILNLIPDKYLENALIDIINNFHYLHIINNTAYYPFMLDYHGLRVSIEFHIEALTNNRDNNYGLETKLFNGFYLIYNAGRTLAFPIRKDLLLKSNRGSQAYNQWGQLGTKTGCVELKVAELGVGLSDILDIHTAANSSLVTFDIENHGRLSYNIGD